MKNHHRLRILRLRRLCYFTYFDFWGDDIATEIMKKRHPFNKPVKGRVYPVQMPNANKFIEFLAFGK